MNIAILEDGLIAIQHKDWETVRKLKRRDYVMGSYISYCQRMINKYGFSAFSKTGLIVNYLKLLEMIADKYCAMFKLVAKSKIHAENETKQLISIYKSIQRVHETYSQKKIIALNNERESLKTTNKQLEYSIETIKELLFDLIEVEVQFQL